MKPRRKTQAESFYDLPKKKQRQMLLKAVINANKEQKALEEQYLKLRKLSISRDFCCH